MRYFTFAQDIWPGSGEEMINYLREMKIKHTMGADWSHDLTPFGYDITPGREHKRGYGGTQVFQGDDNIFYEQYLVNTFVILGTEDDLTAIKMRFDHIKVLKNRTGLKVRNFFRMIFFL